MWAMSDEQLRCYADDELATYEKRQMARHLLNARAGTETTDEPEADAPVTSEGATWSA